MKREEERGYRDVTVHNSSIAKSSWEKMSTIFSHSVREHGSQMRSGYVFFMGSFQVQVNIMYPPRHRRIGMSHKATVRFAE